MDLGQILLLLAAGLAGGAFNAAAGGGSLITFPALLAVGLSPLAANVTSAVAMCGGNLGIVGGYRRELHGQRPRIERLLPVALLGAAAGVVALELSSEDAFDSIVPFLILGACGLLAAQPSLKRRLAERGPATRRHAIALYAGVAVIGGYAAYFGAASGVMMLALLGTLVTDSLQRLNALNRFLVFAANGLAAFAFAFIAPVDWEAALILLPATVVGGTGGSLLARRLSDTVLRAVVIAFGLAAAVYLLATS